MYTLSTVPRTDVSFIAFVIVLCSLPECCVSQYTLLPQNQSSLDSGNINDAISTPSSPNLAGNAKLNETVPLDGNSSTVLARVTESLSTTVSTDSKGRKIVHGIKHKKGLKSSETRTFDIISWLPKPADPHAKVNLTILPILAVLAFLVMLCLKGCTWFRENMKEKDRDSFDLEDHNFVILHEGDKEYHDIDFRSDLSTPYDTYSSYMSFLRRNNNYDTVTSIRSMQGTRHYDTVTSYRSLMLQRLENHNSDSVTSYRAFLQRVKQMKDVEVQVELMEERSKMVDRHSSLRNSRRSQHSNSTSPKVKTKLTHANGEGKLDSLLESSRGCQDWKQMSVSSNGGRNGIHDTGVRKGKHDTANNSGTHDIGVGNGVISHKRHYEKGPQRARSKSPAKTQRVRSKSPVKTQRARSKSPVKTQCKKSSVQKGDEVSIPADSNEGKKNEHTSSKLPRFRVSFVTDDDKFIDIIKANNTHLLEPEEGKLSPTLATRNFRVASQSSSDSDSVPDAETANNEVAECHKVL